MPEPRRDVRQLLEILAAHPVLPPAEALPANDDAFRDLLADLARGEDSSHAETLRAVSAALLVPAEELTRRVRFVLACLVLPPSGNHYEVLGLTRDASAQEIRKRWAALIQRYHPDRLGGSSWLDGQARRLIEAYQTLKDPRRRQEYDAELVAGPGRPLPPPVKRVVRMPASLGSSRARWAPLGIVAVGIAVASWAVLRPVPPPLPRAPLPPAPRLLESPAGAGEPRRAAPPASRGRGPDADGPPVSCAAAREPSRPSCRR